MILNNNTPYTCIRFYICQSATLYYTIILYSIIISTINKTCLIIVWITHGNTQCLRLHMCTYMVENSIVFHTVVLGT